MRILVLGAGAIGGYYGGRLLEAGCDVTFLVRPRRAELLATSGLNIKSPVGDVSIPAPPTIAAGKVSGPYDMVLLTCKAYDLDSAMDDVAAAVGPGTAIVPMLNGMRHLDLLDARFGAEKILGGQCAIGSMLGPDGTIIHLNPLHALGFGERDGTMSSRVHAIAEQMQGANFDGRASETILLDMWEKWCMLATMAGMTSLMRAPVGDVAAAGGADLMLQIFAENCGIAQRAGYSVRPDYLARVRAMITQPGSLATASMMRDISQGNDVEADHVIGDLLKRAEPVATPMLRIAYIHLKTYQARRVREMSAKA